jgi:hypothetical protein
VWLQRLLYPEPPDDDDDSGSEEAGEVRLEVRRQHLLEDSYEQVRGAVCSAVQVMGMLFILQYQQAIQL